MRCENLNVVMYYIQYTSTIDSVILYYIIFGYATTYFTHQT